MSTILQGDIAEGQKWLATVEHMKVELLSIHGKNNPYMSVWRDLSPNVRVLIKLIDGKPKAFIFATGGIFCAVGTLLDGLFDAFFDPLSQASKDGVTWKQGALPELPLGGYWGFAAWNGKVICAVGKAFKKSLDASPSYAIPSNQIALSKDGGFTWEQGALPISAIWSNIIWNGSVFCIISAEEIYIPSAVAYSVTSPDGITWSVGLMPSLGTTYPNFSFWGPIAWNGDNFLALSAFVDGPTDADRAAISTDGLNWSFSNPIGPAGEPRFWSGLAWKDSIFCAVATNDPANIYNNDKVATSPDGITWTFQQLPESNNSWAGITRNGKNFCIIPSNAIVFDPTDPLGIGMRTMTSKDGIEWNLGLMPSRKNWDQVAWSGTLFYAITSLFNTRTIVASSVDGLNWNEKEITASGTSGGLVTFPFVNLL